MDYWVDPNPYGKKKEKGEDWERRIIFVWNIWGNHHKVDDGTAQDESIKFSLFIYLSLSLIQFLSYTYLYVCNCEGDGFAEAYVRKGIWTMLNWPLLLPKC